jgi:hypothetical protein
MNDKLRQAIREIILEEFEKMDENSTSAATPGYMTPKAFTPGEGDGKEGDSVVHRPIKWTDGDGPLKEGRSEYSKYKAKHGSAKEKIGRSIREINLSLTRIHKLLDMNTKLKKEDNVQAMELWKRTTSQITKIERSILDIAHKIKELKA